MRSHNLKLHPVDAVEAVDEEDEDENKGNLHPVLYFGDQWALGNEAIVILSARASKLYRALLGIVRKDPPLDVEREGNKQQHKQAHLGH